MYKILIISSLIFFYLIPLIITKIVDINFKNLTNILIAALIVLFLQIFFNYEYDYTGGGIFFRASHFIFKNNILFYFITFISLILIFSISKKSENLLIIILLILSNVQTTIYHKYYDPLLIILYLTVFNIDINKKCLFNYKNIFIIYIFFLCFLIINIIKT